MTESKLKHLFEELYEIRQQRILAIKDITENYLKSLNYDMSIRDYLSYIWSLTWCITAFKFYLLPTFDWFSPKLINLYINQALSLPTQTANFDVLNFQIEDENQQN